VLHNHPAIQPGGAEQYALELHRAIRLSDDVEPILVARTGPSPARDDTAHPGSPFTLVEDQPDEYLVYTEWDGFDFFHLTSRDKSLFSTYFANFLRAHKPDVVHFQHTLFIGCDLISQVRRTLPEAPILYTLHEYLPICNRDGQLVRRVGGELCLQESPRRCHECFPWVSKGAFYLRKRFIQSHFANVDLFLAPSHFLRNRYVDWGIPPEKIVFEDYGRVRVPRIDEAYDGPRMRLGFFGQLNPYKGIQVVLRAMGMLKQQGVPAHLFVYGANISLHGDKFEAEVRSLLNAAGDNVTVAGPYSHGTLPALMAGVDWVVVPSTWWENSPLVIQEAFLHGRPVICSNVGGMAEKVHDGVNGLHFAAGNPGHLSGTIARAVNTPGLWQTLRAGIPPVHSMDDHIANLTGMYEALIDRRRAVQEATA
jgi:glycosyltransferase involved in cell wall biosynthesis